MQRSWALKETLLVKEWAGAISPSRLAKDLGRDVQDVIEECERLRVPTTYLGAALFWCNECATWRTKITRSGFCQVCMYRRNRRAIEGRIAALLPLLTPSERELYAESEALRTSMVFEPRPTLSTKGMSDAQAHIARTHYLAAIDRWEMRREQRVVKAAQKRKERIQEKARLRQGMPLCRHRDPRYNLTE